MIIWIIAQFSAAAELLADWSRGMIIELFPETIAVRVEIARGHWSHLSARVTELQRDMPLDYRVLSLRENFRNGPLVALLLAVQNTVRICSTCAHNLLIGYVMALHKSLTYLLTYLHYFIILYTYGRPTRKKWNIMRVLYRAPGISYQPMFLPQANCLLVFWSFVIRRKLKIESFLLTVAHA